MFPPADARRYVAAMTGLVVFLLCSIPLMNVAVDPLGYARLAGWRPTNPTESELSFAAGGAWPAPSGTREAKMLNVAYYQPQSVIFGSSTVWSHVDAGYAPLRGSDGRPAYNFGLAGVSMRELLAAFEHAIALKPPQRILVGLEFYMFSADKATSPGFFDLPMAQRGAYRRELVRFVSRRLSTADSTYETQATLWEPVTKRIGSMWSDGASIRRPAPNFGIGVGAGPRPVDAEETIAASPDGRRTRAEFLQLMLDVDRVIIAGLYPAPGAPFRFVDDEGWSSLDAVRRMASIARKYDIDLRFYMSPHHARAYEAIRLMGWWPQFMAWQRGLAAILEDDARAYPGERRIPLWDFGGYTSVTADPVVDESPAHAGYRKYADAIHFLTPVAYVLMDRLFPTASAQAVPPDVGVLVTADSVDEHLARMTREHQRYAAANPDVVAGIAGMLGSLGRRTVGAP